MKYWTNQEIQTLSEYISLPTKEAYINFCDQYGFSIRSYDSFQKKFKKLKEAYSNESDEDFLSDPVEDYFEADRVILPQDNSDKKKQNKEQTKLWLESLVDLAKEEQLNYSPVNNSSLKETTLCLVLSDLHFGKHTKWFNLKEADKRLTNIPLKLSSKIKSNTEIDEVLIILAGDLVEGEDIYPTQNNHIECSAIEQTQVCTESVWQMILNFRIQFPHSLIRIETVPGNHGRVSKTANEKTNWDNVVYMILDMIAKKYNDDKIIINSNFETFKTFKVKDKIGMANHHGVKHTGTSNMREKIAGWIAGKNFDFMVHGHWHEWHVGNWLGRFIMGNGCMCGPDDLAEQMGKEDTARQGYFFVTPNQPVWGFSFIEWPHIPSYETNF